MLLRYDVERHWLRVTGHIEAYTNGDLDAARGKVADDERYSQFQRGLSRVEPRCENAMFRDWCGRLVLYSSRYASSAACNASMLSNGPGSAAVRSTETGADARSPRWWSVRWAWSVVGDAVLPADPLEQHGCWAGLHEPPGKHCAVVRLDQRHARSII